jgi:quercetin dioxygenase-like cupin family protein/DNA-binding XRE family transcriptional regulator
VPAVSALSVQLDEALAAIGTKVRQLRKQQHLSLEELSQRSGVSATAIHKLERNGMVPTIATLMKLALAFDRPVSYFIDEDGAPPAVSLVKGGKGKPVLTSKRGLRLQGVSGPYGSFHLAGAVAEVEPGADSGPKEMEHPGEELVHLLEGALVFRVGGEELTLRPGDTLHFRTDRPHRWRNPGGRPARALWMTMRPS